MARLPRLVVAGQCHAVVQRGHSGAPVFVDDVDRRLYLDALRTAAAAERVAVHAHALGDTEVLLLVTPPSPQGLSRTMQAVGRRHVAAHNRRHGRSGTLWDGRFRCGVVEPGAWRLHALRWIDAAAVAVGSDVAAAGAAARLGGERDPLLVDPPEYWQLGNTPFDREAAYRRLLDDGVSAETAAALRAAATGGWVAGSPAFRASIEAHLARPAGPRARGRPPKRSEERPAGN